MLYRLVKSTLLTVLKAPKEPPEAPAGSHESVQVFRASRRFLVYRLLLVLFGLAIVLMAIAAFLLGSVAAEEPGMAIVALLLALVPLPGLLLAYFLVRVDYDLRYYIVTDRSLRVREGAWSVREMTITYANIQNLRVLQGPLMRLFGIWNLRIDVAGGGSTSQEGVSKGGHHVTFAGIENAHEHRDRILDYQRAARSGSGLGDPDDVGLASAALGGSPAVLAALEELAQAARALSASARSASG